MEWKYILGQAIGLLATLSCLLLPLWKKKWQMLLCNAVGNFLFGVNLLLIGEPRSLLIYAVAVIQSLVVLWCCQKEKRIHKAVNVLFLALYVLGGALGYALPVDLLPIVGSVFNMLATFQRDEQKTRWLLLVNTSVFFVYYILVGSSSVLATVVTMVSTILALWRYKTPREVKE